MTSENPPGQGVTELGMPAAAQPTWTRPWSRLRAVVSGFGIVLIVAIAGLTAYSIWDSREEALARGRKTTETLAHVLETQTRHAFMSAEQSLIYVERMLRVIPRGSPSRAAELNALLLDLVAGQPHVQAMFITDRNGRVIHSSSGAAAAHIDTSDREYFQAHRDRPDRGLYVSPPLESRAGHGTFISVSRRLNGAGGAFDGVVAVAIEPGYFQKFYSQVNAGENGAITLYLRDGTLLFRGPPAPNAVGKSFAGEPLFSGRLLTAPSGSYSGNSPFDGVARVFSYRTLDGLPLVVVVGVDERQLLTDWYGYVKTASLLALIVILVTIVLTGSLAREVGRREALATSLRDSESQYRYLFEASPHPMWIYDPGTLEFLAVNDAALASYGYTRDEFLAMSARDLRPREDWPRFERLLSSLGPALNSSGVWPHKTKGGKVIQAQVTSHGIAFEGRAARLVQAQDVSAQLDAEIRLRESEQHYRSLYENNPHPVWVRDEQTLRILSANQATIDKYGYTLDELRAMTAVDLQFEADRVQVAQQIRDRSATETTHSLRRHVTKDGRIIDADVTAQPFMFGGRPARMILVDDVTERWRAEQALKDSEQRYRALFDLNPSPMWVYDAATLEILTVNEAAVRQYGYSREEFTSMRTSGLYVEEDVPALLERTRARDPAARLVRVVRHRKKDGSVMDVEVRSGPITFNGRASRLALGNDTTQRRRAEIERARLAAIVDGSNDAIVGRDLERKIVSWNAAAERLFGYTAAEAMGQSVSLLIPPDQEERAARTRELLAQGRAVHDLEAVRLAKDGRRIDVAMSQSPIRGDHGSIVGISLIFRDISERKQAAAVRAELAAIVENSTDAIISRMLDGTITSWNSGAEHMFGYTAAQAIGQPITFISPKGHQSGLKKNTERVLSGELIEPYESRRVTRDGRIIDVLAGLSPVRDGAGNITGASVIFHDISALKQAEGALLRERALLRTVIDNLPDRIYVKDSARRYLLVNQSDLRHRHLATDEAILGKTAHDILPRKYADAFDAEDRAVLESGEPLVNREIVVENGDDKKAWIMANKVPLRDAAGKIFGMVGIHRDITEVRQSAEAIIKLNAELEQRVMERTAQLENTNKELESFAYSISHDLRAPLRSIDGFSKALMDDYQDRLEATALDYLRRVRAASQRMATLIDDLLALSRITRSEMRRKATDLSALAEDIVSELRREQPQREIDFSVANGIRASADAGLLRVALENLLGNAWKFTGRQSKAIISVGVENRDGQPVYFIRDNGAGFDMRYADKLFGAFQRLHREADFAGTGVGLATVQRIIRRHGGQIWAEAAVGKGATFFFTLG